MSESNSRLAGLENQIQHLQTKLEREREKIKEEEEAKVIQTKIFALAVMLLEVQVNAREELERVLQEAGYIHKPFETPSPELVDATLDALTTLVKEIQRVAPEGLSEFLGKVGYIPGPAEENSGGAVSWVG